MHLSARLSLLSLLAAPLLLSGCALTNTAAPAATTTRHAIQGSVHGGRSPIVGAHVYVFAASNRGYGSGTPQASVSLLTSATGNATDGNGNYYVVSDSTGSFSITGDYTCTAGTQIYLLATGGNPGLGSDQSNPNLALMTALGQCQSSGSDLSSTYPYVSINEVTTVGSVYAIAGFMTDAIHVSSSSTALAKTGLANAFANVNNLVDVVNGVALSTTLVGNGTVPQSTINTLANILAACVNTVGATSNECTTLFSTAVEGVTQPTDTVTALLNIAHHPGVDPEVLYGMASPAAPYSPSLGITPNDFTLSIAFTGGGLASPDSVAIDAFGNVWAANYNSGISELSSIGNYFSPITGFTGGGIAGPQGVAIDTSDDIWIPNFGGGLAKLNGSSGAAISGASGYTGGGLANPYQSAIDASGNIWTINAPGYGHSAQVAKTNGATGAAISGTNGYTGGGLNNTGAIAIDSSGYVWVANEGNNSVSKLQASNGAAISGTSGYTGGGLAGGPQAIAVDGSGNVWTGNYNGTVSELNGSTGAAISPSSGYTGVSSLGPISSIAIDGLGNVWTTSYTSVFNGTTYVYNSSISNLNGSTGAVLSPSTGYASSSLNQPQGIAIDGSGNLWTANFNSNTLTEFIGIAAPVVTPIAAAVANNTLGTRP